ELLDELQVREPRAFRLAGNRALEHGVERRAHQPHRAHGVVDAAAAEPRLRDRETLTASAEQVVRRDAHRVVTDVRMRALRLRVRPYTDVAHDLHPRRAAR